MKALLSIIGLLLGASPCVVWGQQELIVNGSFESGAQANMFGLPGWDLIGPGDNFSNYGVAQSTGGADVAQQGGYYAFFRGHPTDGSQDCLGQTVNFTVGQQYTVSYYLATDGPTLGTGSSMYVLIGPTFPLDTNADQLLTAYLPDSAAALPYQKFSTIITATRSSEILAFHGVSSNTAILLDNVSITLAVPPPPQLGLHLSPTNTLVFNWTSTSSGYRLQANSSLITTNWVTLTNAPSTLGSANQIVLPVPGSNLFYRLVLP